MAERIAREAARRHYAVNVLAMDDYEVTELPNAARAVFVTSTMGQGDPPCNMKLFWRFLLRKNLPPDSLHTLAFAVFGLGDSHYQKYNATAKKLAKRLEGLGARALVALGLGDDQHPTGHEATLDPWLKQLWAMLRAECPLSQQPRAGGGGAMATLVDPPDDDDEFVAELDPCRLAVEASVASGEATSTSTSSPTTSELCAAAAELDRAVRAAAALDPRILRGGGGGVGGGGGGVDAGVGAAGGAKAGAGTAAAVPYGPKNPLITSVMSNHRLTAEGASNEVRHVVIDAAEFASTSGGGGGYAPGDCLAVMPLGAGGEQDPAGEGVAEVLRRAGLAPDAWVRVSPAAGAAEVGLYKLSPVDP